MNLLNSVLKDFGKLHRINSTHVQLGMSLGVHQKTLWSHVFKLLLFCVFPRHFLLVDTSFLHTEYCGFSYLSQPCTFTTGIASLAKLWEGREKQTELDPNLCKHSSSNEGDGSPSEFWLLQGLIAAGCGWHDRLLWAEVQDNGEWRGHGIFLYPFCPFGVGFSYPWDKTLGLPLEFAPVGFWCLLPVCCVQARGKNSDNMKTL